MREHHSELQGRGQSDAFRIAPQPLLMVGQLPDQECLAKRSTPGQPVLPRGLRPRGRLTASSGISSGVVGGALGSKSQ